MARQTPKSFLREADWALQMCDHCRSEVDATSFESRPFAVGQRRIYPGWVRYRAPNMLPAEWMVFACLTMSQYQFSPPRTAPGYCLQCLLLRNPPVWFLFTPFVHKPATTSRHICTSFTLICSHTCCLLLCKVFRYKSIFSSSSGSIQSALFWSITPGDFSVPLFGDQLNEENWLPLWFSSLLDNCLLVSLVYFSVW